jgi:hypothetical protein
MSFSLQMVKKKKKNPDKKKKNFLSGNQTKLANGFYNFQKLHLLGSFMQDLFESQRSPYCLIEVLYLQTFLKETIWTLTLAQISEFSKKTDETDVNTNLTHTTNSLRSPVLSSSNHQRTNSGNISPLSISGNHNNPNIGNNNNSNYNGSGTKGQSLNLSEMGMVGSASQGQKHHSLGAQTSQLKMSLKNKMFKKSEKKMTE